LTVNSCIVVLVAALSSACTQQPAADRETNVSDPEVKELLTVAAADWDAAAFSPLPTSGSIRLSKKSAATAPDANDAGLLIESEGGSRAWFFNRVNDGYRLVCASESIRGKRSLQHPEVTGGRPYQEILHINFIAQDAGACGTKLKTGLHGIYWGPNGIEEVDRDAVVRLRAQLQR
jgi:hypothetical protein